MQSKFTLFSSVAIGAVVALSVAATADAKTMKHHHHAAAPADDRVTALTSEVETLESRLEAETLAREQMQSQVQAAQSQAAAAQADADAAHTQLQEQIQTIPGVVNSAVAANKPKPTWADNTTVNAKVFMDLSYINRTKFPQPTNGVGFDIKRAYLGVDHKFNDVWSATLLADFAPNGIDVGAGPSSGKADKTGATPVQGSEVVKNAYIQAKFMPELIVQAGAASMPWISFSEDTYGYRYIEKTLTDDNSVANSTDWGVFAKGSFDKGVFNYAIAAVDGAGYKNPVRSSGMDVEGRVSVNYMGFVAGIGGYTGEEAQDVPAISPTAHATANRFDALLGYSNSLFRVGFEYFDANNWKSLVNAAPANKDEQDGYTIYGAYNFTPQISAFARYDWGDPSKKLASNARNEYYNVGIQYEPVKVLDLALVYKHDELSGCNTGQTACKYSDANAAFTTNSKYDEVGLFTQFKF